MKISIITVCFNSAVYIADALRSIDNQDWPDLEHIIVDGGSSDSTLEILSTYAKPWRHVISEPDRGIYDAMNKGLARVTGELIGFLNADDILAEPTTIRMIAEAAARDPMAGAVYGDLIYISKDKADKVVRRWTSGNFDRERLRFGWMPPHPTFYIRSSEIARTGFFNAKFKIAADYDYMLRQLNRDGSRAVYIPEVLVKMRTGGASNRSLSAIFQKSREDLKVIQNNMIGGWFTLFCKNFRKIKQFI
jgi:glycosyltransferase